MMILRKSERKKAKIKMALQGSAGAGKSFSALLLAKGLTDDNLSKVAVIDSENGSADLYSSLGDYNVLSLKPPYTPENYIKAIEVCEKARMEVIILDGVSQCWEELLDFHSKLAGNSFTNWAKVNTRQKLFVDKILQADAHIIATIRSKQGYILNQKDGKFIPEKVGLKAIQKNNLDYEFTLVFDVDIKHFASSSKDRTGLFMGKPEFVISVDTGKEILDWCNSGAESDTSFKPSGILQENTDSEESVKSKIAYTNNLQELLLLYREFPQHQEALRSDFELRKSFLNNLSNPQNFSSNGHTN